MMIPPGPLENNHSLCIKRGAINWVWKAKLEFASQEGREKIIVGVNKEKFGSVQRRFSTLSSESIEKN